jgi:hypothetical protein
MVKTLKTGPIGCPERNYHYSLRNKPEERSTLLIIMFAACVHINRACLVETDLCVVNSKIQIQNSLMNYELIYQLGAIEYLFVYFQLDMFRVYTPIFKSNGCYNFFTYTAYGVL